MKKPAREFVYRGPAGQLEDRLARLEAHRQHVVSELRSLEKFLVAHPELGQLMPASGLTKLRLVVDNKPRLARRQPLPRERLYGPDDGPPEAA